MADALNRKTKELRQSINAADFPVADWIIDPDLSAVQNVPTRHWKISGDVVVEMSQAEKDNVDTALLSRAKSLKHLEIKDNSGRFILDSLVGLEPGANPGAFQTAFNTAIRSRAASARTIKDQIDSALTFTDLEAIHDQRT